MNNIEITTAQTQRSPRKKRRIFLWVFLAIQAIFIVWIVSGVVGAQGTPDECGALARETCNAAANVGSAIGLALVFGLWIGVDIVLGVGYGIYHLAKR